MGKPHRRKKFALCAAVYCIEFMLPAKPAHHRVQFARIRVQCAKYCIQHREPRTYSELCSRRQRKYRFNSNEHAKREPVKRRHLTNVEGRLQMHSLWTERSSSSEKHFSIMSITAYVKLKTEENLTYLSSLIDSISPSRAALALYFIFTILFIPDPPNKSEM